MATIKRADVTACARPSDLAKLIGKDGKRVRDYLRKQGIYVSRGGAFTDEVKVDAAQHFGATVK